jgi:hypothetical protein
MIIPAWVEYLLPYNTTAHSTFLAHTYYTYMIDKDKIDDYINNLQLKVKT